jgi:hypothetical protein
MTNMIKAIDLTADTRIVDAAGEVHTISRVRRIDSLRCRIDTREGKTLVIAQDACFHLDD